MTLQTRYYFLTEQQYPYYPSPAAAGFPSPGEEFAHESLNLNELLIKHQSATFFMQVEGDSMNGAHIYNGDIIIVDRALKPVNGSLVVASVNNELVIKRLKKDGQNWSLISENPNYKPIVISDELESSIWGVVTFTIHRTR